MDMREIEKNGKALIGKAKKGDGATTRELFDRPFEKALQTSKVEVSDSNMPVPYSLLSPSSLGGHLRNFLFSLRRAH